MSRRYHDNEAEAVDEDDDGLDDGVPLHRKKPFGSGISKRPIKFVPASTPTPSGDGVAASQVDSGQSAAELYLSIVMKPAKSDGPPATNGVTGQGVKSPGSSSSAAVEICEVCKLPIVSTDDEAGSNSNLTLRQRHEASLAHQVSLAHSHPPSALDRSRMGLAVLQSYGWDPDSRRGLGAEAQGIAFPLKPKPREDGLGIGADDAAAVVGKAGGGAAAAAALKKKPETLDAGKVRKKAEADKKKMERLRQQVFGNVNLEKYLGPGA
ncbi:hypothetical protein MAPG_05297 [Magnaporthiopsis poae ATCC 64411]|uniref:G-patch domain-containing protein n=1 Tax=Magnaporthiopsis poae (strain ATCC 64411 / 73-15) TaxID=644358 RepID=A0A0C4DZ10_MAGP6|nr:hypothetical protein MAPG_05297 [Magnaporthiopsis poae ATCC 64411]